MISGACFSRVHLRTSSLRTGFRFSHLRSLQSLSEVDDFSGGGDRHQAGQKIDPQGRS